MNKNVIDNPAKNLWYADFFVTQVARLFALTWKEQISIIVKESKHITRQERD